MLVSIIPTTEILGNIDHYITESIDHYIVQIYVMVKSGNIVVNMGSVCFCL